MKCPPTRTVIQSCTHKTQSDRPSCIYAHAREMTHVTNSLSCRENLSLQAYLHRKLIEISLEQRIRPDLNTPKKQQRLRSLGRSTQHSSRRIFAVFYTEATHSCKFVGGSISCKLETTNTELTIRSRSAAPRTTRARRFSWDICHQCRI